MKTRITVIVFSLCALVLAGCSSGKSKKPVANPTEAPVATEETATPRGATKEKENLQPPTPDDQGNQSAAPSHEHSRFNNYKDCEKWGDESDFFRAVEMKDSNVHISEFASGKLTLSQRCENYALIVHCHNASGKEQKNVAISVEYPMKVSDSGEAHASICENQAEVALNASIELKAESPLQLQPLSGSEIIALDGKGGKVKFEADGSVALDKAFTTIRLDLPKDADYTFFVVLRATFAD